jgi:hypothetical protein
LKMGQTIRQNNTNYESNMKANYEFQFGPKMRLSHKKI